MTLPFQMAREGAQRRELAHERAALSRASMRRAGEEGADVERLEAENRLDPPAARRDDRSGRPGTAAGRGHRPRRSLATAGVPWRARRAIAVASRRVSGAPGSDEVEGRSRVGLTCSRFVPGQTACHLFGYWSSMPNRFNDDRIADVLIPLALDTAYSYAVPGRARAQARATSCRCRSAPARRRAWSGTCATGAGANFKARDGRHRRAGRFRRRCASFSTGSPGTPSRRRARRSPWASSSPRRDRAEMPRVGRPPCRPAAASA